MLSTAVLSDDQISFTRLRMPGRGLLSLAEVPKTWGKHRDMSGLQPGKHPQTIPMQVSTDITESTVAPHHRTSYEYR